MAILVDQTSACNLHCRDRWAVEYDDRLNLTYDEIDSIIHQGKEMGVYMYIYTGGKPLMRKKDLLALCEKHDNRVFLSFTNATLIDGAFAGEMLRVKNFVSAISVEGDEGSHDGRRGNGSYGKVVRAMDILKKNRLLFGSSCCYTSQNCESISSETFYDQMIEWGASFVWYFYYYMPVGNDAVPELLPSPEQRKQIYDRLRVSTRRRAFFAMDFQNDAEYVGRCIAGGRRYLHINANGDVDPCVFIHFSDSNIRGKTLLECLRSPLFMGYHDGQPFNGNMFRPCPMLEKPEKQQAIAEKTDIHGYRSAIARKRGTSLRQV